MTETNPNRPDNPANCASTDSKTAAPAPADKQHYLRQAAAALANANGPLLVFQQALSALATGQPLDEAKLYGAMKMVHERHDTCDFAAAMLVRMLHLYGDSPCWPEELKAYIRKELLDFTYWFSHKRSPFSGREIFWTENHVLLYRSSEYAAGLYYSNHHFKGRGVTGEEAARLVQPAIEEWIRIKAAVGFSEWDSHCYSNENILSLLNVYDFAADRKLKRLAGQMLDLICFGMAVNSHKGVYGCTTGRTYARFLLNTDAENTAPIQALLWGRGCGTALSSGAIALATSTYECPDLIRRIALDGSERLMVSKEQQSFDVEEGPLLGKGFEDEEDLTLYWHNMGYTHRDIIRRNWEIGEKYGISINHELFTEYKYVQDCRRMGMEPEPCRAMTYLSRVNKITVKTADYMLSCAQDYRKGERGFQQHIWQATLDGGIKVFVNHPGTLQAGVGRPDFWAGNGIFPRAVQQGSVLICLFRLPEGEPWVIPFTHAHFPKQQFDETGRVGNWVFGRKNRGYIALYSQHGCHWAEEGEFAGRELRCNGTHNVWICQMGTEGEYGSFGAFAAAVLAAGVSVAQGTGPAAESPAAVPESEHKPSADTRADTVTFHSPSEGVLTFGWDAPLTVNGQTVGIADYPRFDNPYCHTERFAREYSIRHKDEVHLLKF